MNEHVPGDWLELYSKGTLQEDRLAQVEEHLLICEQCRTRLTKLDDAWGLNG
ncbi:MAG TPA: zf-HC2 domain-containing protein [Bryobacteraceae bacterium]|nr:zf-HC2 domain-containing protein [Bryobacteraceae bacterium]